MTAKQLRLSLILLALVGLFQNCSPPDVTSGTVAAGGKSASSSSTSTTTGTKAALTTSYAPSTVKVSSQVVITASGGTSPYTYSKASGAGTLSSNVYTATASNESVIIAVKDSTGLISYVYFNVTGGTTVVAATPIPTPAPTPAQAASSNGATTLPNGTQIARGCDLPSIATYALGDGQDREVRGTVRYLICLAVGRNPNSNEVQSYTDAIENNDGFDPLTIAQTYYFSSEGVNRYGLNSLSNSDFVLLTVRVLLRREPTAIELAGATLQLTQGTSRQDLFYAIEGKYLVVEDSFLARVMADFKAAQN